MSSLLKLFKIWLQFSILIYFDFNFWYLFIFFTTGTQCCLALPVEVSWVWSRFSWPTRSFCSDAIQAGVTRRNTTQPCSWRNLWKSCRAESTRSYKHIQANCRVTTGQYKPFADHCQSIDSTRIMSNALQLQVNLWSLWRWSSSGDILVSDPWCRESQDSLIRGHFEATVEFCWILLGCTSHVARDLVELVDSPWLHHDSLYLTTISPGYRCKQRRSNRCNRFTLRLWPLGLRRRRRRLELVTASRTSAHGKLPSCTMLPLKMEKNGRGCGNMMEYDGIWWNMMEYVGHVDTT